MEVIAELRSARDADLYRFDPPTDATGENLYRVTLARLDRLAVLHSEETARVPLAFARAEASERLGDFSAAARFYQEASIDGSELGKRASELASFDTRMATLTQEEPERGGAEELLRRLESRRDALLRELEQSSDDSRRSLVEVEVERLDVRTREFLWRYRAVLGTERGLAFAESLITTHGESRRALEHMLRLADMFAEIARAMVASADPDDHEFDAESFLNVTRAASAIYAEIATVDGRPERDEARAGLASIEGLVARIGTTR